MKKLLQIGTGPGIGMAVAKQFGSHGFDILMVARNAERLASFQKELAALGTVARPCPADLTDTAGFAEVLRKTILENGPIDVLHFNASTWRPADIENIDIDSLLDDFKTGVASAVQAVQAVLPGMKTRGGGTVLLTGGGSALAPMPQVAALGLVKAAMRHLAFSLAEELRPHGIRVAMITIAGSVQPGTRFDPGLIAEEFWRLYRADGAGVQTETIWK